MRVLITVDEGYRLYSDVLAGSLKAMRQILEVATVALDDFEERLNSFGPHVVVCAVGRISRATRDHLRGSTLPSIPPCLFNGLRSFGSTDVTGR